MITDDMDLPEGKTCGDCAHLPRCQMLFQCKPTNTRCDWSPARFVQRTTPTIVISADKKWSPYP